MSGGWGNDTFQFTFNHIGADRIADFDPRFDLIQIEFGPRAFDAIDLRQQSGDVLVLLPRGQIVFFDTDLSDLGAKHS